MTDYYWPAELPFLPLKDEYQEGMAMNTLRTQMEFGPAKVRRRTSANMSQLTASYDLFTEYETASGRVVDQKALFEAFMLTAEGLPFWLPDPTDPSRYLKVRIKAQSEEQSVTLTPVFSGLWNVTLNMEVYPFAVKPRP